MSAVMPWHVVRPSVCDAEVSWSRGLELLENNFTQDYPKIPALRRPQHRRSTPKGTLPNFSHNRSGVWKSWLWAYKTGNIICETVEDNSDRWQLLLTALIKSCMVFPLPPMHHLWARFKVIDSLNAANVMKCSFVLTVTPCTVAGDVIFIRPTYSCARASMCWEGNSRSILKFGLATSVSPQRLKAERKLVLTTYMKSYKGFRLPTNCTMLNNIWARFKFNLHRHSAVSLWKHGCLVFFYYNRWMLGHLTAVSQCKVLCMCAAITAHCSDGCTVGPRQRR